MEAEEPLRIPADCAHQSLDFCVETLSQFNPDGRVLLDRFKILLAGFRMKDGAFHRPRVCLALSKTSSAGMP